jgi:hypothetical protein
MKFSFCVILAVLSLSGCTSLVTFFASANACGRENVYCGKDRLDERDAAIDFAEEAYEYDKKIYGILIGKPAESPTGNGRGKDVIYCEDGEEKVCISTGECKCI